VESDPIRLLGGINTYVYVGANPLNKVDSLGLCPNTSELSPDCLNALLVAHTDKKALTRVGDNWKVIQEAATAHSIDPNLLAAIAIRETGFQNISQRNGGKGRGVFQIDIGKNPSVKEAKAKDLTYSANFAAKMLATNMAILSAKYPRFTETQLLQATAASYNFGTKNIKGNPDKIDDKTAENNYGSNVLNILTNCFQTKEGTP
jgi:hypothetical protein